MLRDLYLSCVMRLHSEPHSRYHLTLELFIMEAELLRFCHSWLLIVFDDA